MNSNNTGNVASKWASIKTGVGNLIIQGGGGSGSPVTFPKPFINTPAVVATQTNGSHTTNVDIQSVSKTGFSHGHGGGTVYWIAIGY